MATNFRSKLIRNLNYSWLKFVVFAVLLIGMNISIEELTDKNINGAEILFVRSIFNLIFALLLAGASKQSIIPKQPKLQIAAFICLGLSLLLIFTAYQYISAGSVNTVQRLDIPLLTLFSVFSVRFSTKQFTLSALAFGFLVALLLLSKTTDEEPIGYYLVVAGVIIISIYTLLQKKIAVTENIATIMFIVSLSSVFWSGIRCLQIHTTFKNISITILAVIAGLSLINFVIFYIINDLYKKHTPELVRYPYLIAAFGTMLAEMIVEHKIFNPLLIIGNIAVIIVLTLLVTNRQILVTTK